MINQFTNFEGKKIGINPDHVVSVYPDPEDSPLRAIVHTVDGRQCGVVGSVDMIIRQLNMRDPGVQYA